jgi:hypothetical protein
LVQELLAARRDLPLQSLLRLLNAAELLISTTSTNVKQGAEEPRNCGELSNRGARRATRSRRLRQHPPAYA